jgi:hypothetical protein
MIPTTEQPADKDAFFKQLVTERRIVIRLRAERLYGTALDING